MHKKTMTQLRGLAQSMGVRWSFEDDKGSLIQKIALKQSEMLPLPVVQMPDDQRLRIKPPSKVSDEETLMHLLQPYIEMGLKIEFADGRFYMSYTRTDSGTLRQPPRVILDCAKRIMSP